ncbi:MAG: Gfo/Idh/MocA family oxidoreductase [Candidatus Hydrogenedentes bacterium]|nr:Gfo/Idh/MocA family oxidoreductase [Candidatus Hydrogenedentota bacterium]
MANEIHNRQHADELTRRSFLQHTTTTVFAASATLGATRRATAANDRIGVGVIGTGARGKAHLSQWHRMAEEDKNIEIVALCDIYRPRLNRAAEKYPAKTYMDHRELLADPAVDMVSIATPDHNHAHQVIDAVRAGKDVYCEKPFTHWRQFEALKEVHAAVKASGRAFQLGTQGMSDTAWRQMKKLVQEGLIGQPLLAECGYFRVGDWGERGMEIDDQNAKPGPDLNWEAFLGDSPKRDFDVSRFFRWRMYEDYAGGPCTDLFPHSLTPVTSVLGVGMPECAVATGGKFRYQEREIPDTFNMLLDYPGGFTIAILGTQGNDHQGTSLRGAGGRVPTIRGWEGTLTIEGEEIVFRPIESNGDKDQRFPIERGEKMFEHCRNLVQCRIEGRTDTWADVDLSYHTQTALIMGYQAFREGKTIRFDAEKQAIIA